MPRSDAAAADEAAAEEEEAVTPEIFDRFAEIDVELFWLFLAAIGNFVLVLVALLRKPK